MLACPGYSTNGVEKIQLKETRCGEGERERERERGGGGGMHCLCSPLFSFPLHDLLFTVNTVQSVAIPGEIIFPFDSDDQANCSDIDATLNRSRKLPEGYSQFSHGRSATACAKHRPGATQRCATRTSKHLLDDVAAGVVDAAARFDTLYRRLCVPPTS